MEFGWDYRNPQNQGRYTGAQPSATGLRRQPLQIDTHSRSANDGNEVLAYVLQSDGTMAEVRQDDNTALMHNPQIMAALKAEQQAQLHGETTGRIHSASGGNRKLSSGVIEALTTDRSSSTASTPPFSPSSGIGSSGSVFASPPANTAPRQASQPRRYVPRATPITKANGASPQSQMQTNIYSVRKPNAPPPQYSPNSRNRDRFLYPEGVPSNKAEMNNNTPSGYKPTASNQTNAAAVRKYQQNSSRPPPPVPNPSPEISRRQFIRQSSEGQHFSSPFQMFANNDQRQRVESSKTETWWIKKLQSQQKTYQSQRDEELEELNDIRPVRLRTRSRSQPRLRTHRDEAIDSGFRKNEIMVEYQPMHSNKTPHPPADSRSRSRTKSYTKPLEVDTSNRTAVHQSSAGLSIQSPTPPKESPTFQRADSSENIQIANHQKPRRRNSLKIVKKTSGEEIEVTGSGTMHERGRGDTRPDLYASRRLQRARSAEPKSSRQKVLMENRVYQMSGKNNFYSDM